MAHLHLGDPAKADQRVIDAIASLDDSFHALVEFDLRGVQVDAAIVRANPDGPSTLIVTETKSFAYPVRGMDNGRWQRLNENGEWEELPASERHVNPYRQAVNASDAFQDWLWKNQPLYRPDKSPVPRDLLKPWPNLLMISNTKLNHQLPLYPATGFGRWFADIDEWIRHVRSWVPHRHRVSLTDEEIARMADLLGLTSPRTAEPHANTVCSLDIATALTSLAEWARRVDERLQAIESEPPRRVG